MPQLAPARRNITEDDGPTYRGGSSDEDDIEIVGVTDIKPSTFTKTTSRNADKERVAESPLGQREGGKTFKEITAAAFYRPGAGSLTAMAEKRKADGTMATGGAGSNEPLSKKPRSGYNHTTDHSRYLSTIADYQIRERCGAC
jgi:SWI/SNF-related matrix-associated actin-dependent regulator 1 of chromatin subfamily A